MADADSKKMYEHPLVSRYASKEMSYIWSPEKKFSTWRKLWVALAKAEKELGKKSEYWIMTKHKLKVICLYDPTGFSLSENTKVCMKRLY